MTNKPTPDREAIRLDLMADHVPYEIAMMRHTYDALFGGKVQHGTVCANAHGESFAIHARALIEFLRDRAEAKAAHYTRRYTAFAQAGLPCGLVEKLNQQIAHITEQRFSDEEKLSLQDIKDLRPLLDAEVTTFVSRLLPKYAEVWDTKKGHLRPWSA